MTKKKDLYNLHCRVKYSTAEVLKTQAEEHDISLGEVIDQLVAGFEHFCMKEEEWLKETDINGTLNKLMEKVDRIEKKIGSGAELA